MESKKTKLTISGGPKKSFKSIDSLNNQGKKTVIINKQQSKFSGKSKTFKGSGYKSSSTSFKDIRCNYEVKSPMLFEMLPSNYFLYN